MRKLLQGASMRAFRRVLFVAFLILSGCQKAAPSVVIDNWWTVDIAKNTCKQVNACGSNPDDPGNVQEYINSLKAQFAVAPICQGVSVFDARGKPNPAVRLPSGGETLLVDYVPNQATQHFSIMGEPSNAIDGNGSVDDIVRRTCAAARGLGGKVQ